MLRRSLRTPHARRRASAMLGLATMAWWTANASAQLDPLLFVKRVPPTVIIVFDTSVRMLEDGSGNYYDPVEYTSSSDAGVASAMGVSGATRYRRIYKNLQYESVVDASSKFEATDITAVGNTAAGYSTFYNSTRLEIAKTGIKQAVGENAGAAYRWGLIKLRQTSPAWRASPNCDKPVRVTGNDTLAPVSDSNPCNAGSAGKFGIYVPSVASANYSNETLYGGTARLVTPASNTSTSMIAITGQGIGVSGGLIPAGAGARTYNDRPISHALDDARAAAVAAMTADTAANRTCRNTVVILITSGKDEGNAAYTASHNPETIATSFLNVTASGTTKRVPIHVLAIKPAAGDETQLQGIATKSGGRYVNVTSAAEIARNINYAVQAGFTRSTDFQTSASSEFVGVSPIVATVNLKGALAANGTALPNTDVNASPGGQALSQRSNMLLTAGFSLPGFDGVLRAFRVYRPEPDSTKATGWKFVNDGTKLWPDLDGRPSLAGQARVPADPNARNIYTFIPDGSGGGSMVAFNTTNEATLRSHMNITGSAASVISFVRSQALGAVIGSTPAVMDVPSLDPPPDDDYGYSDAATGFAATYKNRRALIFFGGNNGMIHAVDARTGYELWAFIPYNLLPKLGTLTDGQPIEQFDYFVDSSPKIAEVKLNGTWRSLLLIGEGPGGTFYQAFDVTDAGMGVAPDQGDLSSVTSLLQTFDTPNESIQFKWSFPSYSSFNPAYTGVFTVTDATSGGKVKLYGDLKSTATAAEKTVGFTWSDPAVGPLTPDRSTNAVIVGSGYFPDIESLIPARGSIKAGNALYLIDADTGLLIGNPSGSCSTISSGSGSSDGCAIVGDVSNGRKNALQADPTAAGKAGSVIVEKAYLGDIDGKYWRFDFSTTGSISTSQMVNTTQPIFASSALLFIGSADVYMFFSTGSDLYPSNASGGTGTFKLYGLKDNGAGVAATANFTINLAATTNSAGLATGERPSTSPSVAGDIVFYTTTSEDATTPCADFTGKLYGVTYAGGAAYDSNANGQMDKTESPIAATLAGRATAPFIVDQHLYLGSVGANGVAVEAFGDPEDFNNGVGQVGVRILSWREIR
ncbi:MAG: PilC/PilY family type IV pilus protein [Acidobacteriota bacterium]|nr:PilC/PilY family type IV pilus protein [Acidobacteriota bacterium]